MHFFAKLVLPLALLSAAVSAHATQIAVFGSPTAGLNNFNDTVVASGVTANHDRLTDLTGGKTSFDLGDYTITRTNGSVMGIRNYGTLSGQAIDMSANNSANDGGKASGITLTFDKAVNAVGFEVGDWGTCCLPSALFISFEQWHRCQVR